VPARIKLCLASNSFEFEDTTRRGLNDFKTDLACKTIELFVRSQEHQVQQEMECIEYNNGNSC
jgi:hypothetical protein